MVVLCHKRSTVLSIFQISISEVQNMAIRPVLLDLVTYYLAMLSVGTNVNFRAVIKGESPKILPPKMVISQIQTFHSPLKLLAPSTGTQE